MMERVLHFVREFLEHIGQVGERVANILLSPLSALVQHRMLHTFRKESVFVPNPIVRLKLRCARHAPNTSMRTFAMVHCSKRPMSQMRELRNLTGGRLSPRLPNGY